MDSNNNNNTTYLSPFHSDKVDPNLFFSGAQQGKILAEIKKAICDGVAIITLTGDEGTGKTTICKMLYEEMPDDFTGVYVPEILRSFDDVVRVISSHIGTEHTVEEETSTVLIEEIIDNLQENDRRLVVIFDQAEKMYLATIERIRKMLDVVNCDEHRLQLIFSGRHNLLENLKQLKICDFGDAEEKDYVLYPLDISETYDYLEHCGRHAPTTRGKDVFTPEIAEKIHNIADGNLRNTNTLAVKTLEAAEVDESVEQLLESFIDDSVEHPRAKQMSSSVLHLIKGINRQKLLYTGMGLLTVVLLAFIIGDDEKSLETGVEISQKTEKQDDIPPPKSEEISPPLEEADPVESAEKTIQDAISSTEQVEEQPTPEIANIDEKEDEEIIQLDSGEAEQDFSVSEIKEDSTEIIIVQQNDTETQSSLPVAENEIEEPALPSQPVSISAEKRKKIFELRLNETDQSEIALEDNTTVPAGDIGLQDAVVDTAEMTEREAQNRGEEEKEGTVAPTDEKDEAGQIALSPLSVQENKQELEIQLDRKTVAPLTAEQQLAASAESLSAEATEAVESGGESEEADSAQEVVIFEGMSKRFPLRPSENRGPKNIVKIAPVKLKVPTDDQIDTNIDQGPAIIDVYQKRLAAGSGWYATESDNIFTVQLMVLTAGQAEQNLKKRFQEDDYKKVADNLYIIKNNESKVFVFYGQYPDLDSAKQARNTLPIFLRKYDPYAISVKEAMSKAGPLE